MLNTPSGRDAIRARAHGGAIIIDLDNAVEGVAVGRDASQIYPKALPTAPSRGSVM